MNKQLLVISESTSFPWGMAAANRVRNLARALLDDDWTVEYLALRGAEVSVNGTKYNSNGVEAGIAYVYPGSFTTRPSNWWLRRIDDVTSWSGAMRLLISRKKAGEVDAVMLYSRNEKVAGFWIPFLHALKIPVILEMCEWPLALAEVNESYRQKAEKFCREIVPKADAVLPISSFIENEIKEMATAKGKVLPSLKVPILIDIEKYEKQPQSKTNDRENYMLYCGSFAYMDIARIVVDIVHTLHILDMNLPVIFTGKENARRLSELQRYADQKGVLQLFTFTGYVDESELHRLMRHALCLLAPLPENPQSESRFSTKIGYYLASGTPVVTNNVGDVGDYLHDGENAYVTSRCDASLFATKITDIIADPSAAECVGRAGQSLAFDTFHYTKACSGLSDFFRQVVEKYTS